MPSPSKGFEAILVAPHRLERRTSEAFRRAGMALVDGLPQRGGRLIVELGDTEDADSSGFAALIALHRYAARRGHRVRLRHVSGAMRSLLVLTKLDRSFEHDD